MDLTLNFINNLLSKTYFQFDVYYNALSSLAKNWETIANNPYFFNNEISFDFKITDQKSSGRCWLFASLNLLRFIASQTWSQQMDIKELEFSQSYLFFWDKFERYNRNLEHMLTLNNMNGECQYFTHICKEPLSDGGQWDMAKDLITKYGIVPKYIYPDSYHAKSSSSMNKILTEMLKNDWISLSKIKNLKPQEYDSIIQQKMTKVFEVLVKFLGKPPTSFNFEFKHKNKTVVWKNLTPLELLEKSKFIPDEWITIVNDPRKENPYNKYYQVEFLGNTGWLNLPMERIKELAVKSIDKNQPVWFGCDVGADRDKESGISDINIINYNDYLNLDIKMNKEERLRYYSSVPSHAMLLSGYNKMENDSYPNRWKVENSWGSTSGTNGFLLLTDIWFDQYVFEIVVHKDLLNNAELNEIGNIYKMIPPWDPLGTLAKKID